MTAAAAVPPDLIAPTLRRRFACLAYEGVLLFARVGPRHPGAPDLRLAPPLPAGMSQ